MGRRVGVVLIVAALAVATVLVIGKAPREAEAGFTSEKVKSLVSYLGSGAPHNLKLMALDALRKKTDSGVEGELEKIAKGKDTRLAVAATTALGRKKSTTAKTRLKGLLENKKLSSPVRVGALSAILYSWKDKGDFTYLASKTEGDAKLTAHYTRIKTKLFAQGGE